MKIKTNELIGATLDWAVELAKGTHWSGNGYFVFKNPDGTTRIFERKPEWRYSTDWSQGGPIIEREYIAIFSVEDRPFEGIWAADQYRHQQLDSDEQGDSMYSFYLKSLQYGPTPLIAAMRCFVASKLGDEVEIPEELL